MSLFGVSHVTSNDLDKKMEMLAKCIQDDNEAKAAKIDIYCKLVAIVRSDMGLSPVDNELIAKIPELLNLSLGDLDMAISKLNTLVSKVDING